MRERLQRFINRFMYGDRDDPVSVISKLGERLEATGTPEAVLPGLVETVAQTLKLPYAAIELEERGSHEVAAAFGLPVDQPVRYPLVYQAETVGYLVVAPRSKGETFSSADQDLLQNIAHQAGPVAHNVRLTSDLRRSRRHLVTAREEERRRLRRDLHDGLGPQLASQALTLEAIEKLLEQDPEKAVELVKDLKAQSQAAVHDIRNLIYELRPPALDDLGLVEALREIVTRYKQNGLQVIINVQPKPLPPLPAAVELAAYRIAQEAVNNVFKHAEARTCELQLALENAGDQSGLKVQVVDDGKGYPRDLQPGVGLHSMRERAEELGGHIQFVSRSIGGTRVSAWLPFLAHDLGMDK
jgi:signal transduction histidine kinase